MKFIKLFESYINKQVFDLEDELTIVDTIKRDVINDSLPYDAQYARLNSKGEFIQKIYKFKNNLMCSSTTTI
jgi:hypothetical protein